ncbi:DUF5343 domain-containing protein [Casimicrobium huifangae]|uniref:DUF5343 domain-containing protein n=1 Tax=Casimicrobium huifangae TaxID=2591109 RepID=UPI0012EB6614|nr:DUF5343 domain-containing protein [Casimicrobium huifangae]
MSANLPYVASPGSIKTALEKIRSAATPERVTKDFVTTVLQIKGGTGGNIPPFLKRIGFVGSDGAPTDLYKRFRNPATGGGAAPGTKRLLKYAIEALRAAANHCELDRKACPIVDLQAGFSAMLVAGNGHQTRLRWDVGSIPKPGIEPVSAR